MLRTVFPQIIAVPRLLSTILLKSTFHDHNIRNIVCKYDFLKCVYSVIHYLIFVSFFMLNFWLRATRILSVDIK